MVQFNLGIGMRNQDFYDEVTGRISGESRQQVQAFLHDNRFDEIQEREDSTELGIIRHLNAECREKHLYAKLKPYERNYFIDDPTFHEIVHKDGDYAIMEKTWWQNNYCDDCGKFHVLAERDPDTRAAKYYLMGINTDDELYFLHPLWSPPKRLGIGKTVRDWLFRDPNEKAIRRTVNWVMRYDQGFDGMIQGDILYQYVTMDGLLARLEKPIEKVALFYPHNYPEIGIKSLLIGNRHKLMTDGVIRRFAINQNTRNMWFINAGSYVRLTHPEHKTVEKELFPKLGMLIGIQRGTTDGGQDD